VNTLVVGGGQAGLVMSHMLSRRQCPHLVLEKGQVCERWRSERWDELCFQFPNWSVQLPDFPLPHTDPDAFATRAQILEYLEAYAAFVAPPIRCGVAVTALRAANSGRGFVVDTSVGERIESENVVVATGPYQRAIVPEMIDEQAGIMQVHASRYRNPEQLAGGAVLVVGAGASGVQIAEELARAGRRVYLSVGRHRRFPRHYRGRDFIWWLQALGLYEMTVEQRGPLKPQPLISGAYGGNTIDLREFAERGIVLLGRAMSVHDDVVEIAPDLKENLAAGDDAYDTFLAAADEFVQANELDLRAEPDARKRRPDPTEVVDPISRLDLREAGIGAVVWATGYAPDYGWIELPVVDEHGAPIHRHGISPVDGVYFLGLQWMYKMKSSFLSGVSEDAERLADLIVARG